jgi:hypothetical protein
MFSLALSNKALSHFSVKFLLALVFYIASQISHLKLPLNNPNLEFISSPLGFTEIPLFFKVGRKIEELERRTGMG